MYYGSRWQYNFIGLRVAFSIEIDLSPPGDRVMQSRAQENDADAFSADGRSIVFRKIYNKSFDVMCDLLHTQS